MKYSDGKDYKVIALCMAKFDGDDQRNFIKTFYDVCLSHNFKLQIFSTLTDFYFESLTDAAEEQIFDLMEPDKYDAVLIFTSSFKRYDIPERIAQKVLKTGTPCFSMIAPLKGCINVLYSYYNSFEVVVRHMVEHHHPKYINFIAGFKDNEFSEERIEVYKKVLRENNIPIEDDRIGYGEFWEAPAAAVLQTFLDSGKPIDCIICANDMMAMEVCRRLRAKGIRVPEDIMVSGFDGVDLEKYHYPRLTTSRQDLEDFSEKIADVIDECADGLQIESEYEVGCKFRVGQSCGCNILEFSRENVMEMGKEIFDANRHERTISSHVESLFEKVPLLGNTEYIAQIWGDVVHFVRDFIGGDFIVALNNDFLDEDMEIWPNIRPMTMSEAHHYYTDQMTIPFRYVDGVHTEVCTINKTNLLPNLEGHFAKNSIQIFLPIHAQGSTIGYVAQGFWPNEFEYFMLYSLTMNIRHILEMHKYRIDQQNLYSTDLLTKLLNRRGFYRHMESHINQAVKDHIPMGVISIDMNWLKQINDTYGHKEGDFALAKIGAVMESSVGDNAVCTRFGGDEFAIAFIAENAEEEAERIIADILKKLDKFNASKKKPYPLSISKGYVIHVPDNRSNSIERFIVEADRKMYADKSIFKENNHWEDWQES